MKNIKLTIRLKLIIFASFLVLLLCLTGLYSIQSRKKMAKIENTKYQLKEIWVKTLELRKAEKDFLLRESQNMEFFETGNSKYVNMFDTVCKSIKQSIQSLAETDYIKDNNYKSDMDGMMSLFEKYDVSFNELTKAKFRRGEMDYGLIGEMRKAVKAVEAESSHNGNITAKILTLRRHEKDYLLRGDLKYVDEHNKTMNEIIRSGGISKAMSQNLAVYQKALADIVKLDEEIGRTEKDGLMGTLRADVHKVEPAVTKLVDEINKFTAMQQQSEMTITFILLGIGIVIAVIVSFIIIRSITSSLNMANRTIERIANGDLDFEIKIDTKDEIGGLLEKMKTMTSKLKDVILNIRIASENITAASNEMSSSSQLMAEGASEQASSAEEISSSMEEMAANILQNTNNSKQTEKIAQKASADVSEGSKAVNQTVESMKTIAGKISIIEEIARQTNLLALNAAVEAARAGEHGRGFAVVAAEVRKLAERSEAAAVEINALSSSSVDVAQRSGELLNQVVPDIIETAGLVQEITAASIEQSSGSEQINNAIQQLNTIVQQNAASAEEIAATSEELSAQAEHMKEQIAFFKTGHEAQSGKAVKPVTVNKKTAKQENGKSKILHPLQNGKNGFAIDLADKKTGLDAEYQKF